MAQFGSALDWGSRGHGFKSRYSDQKTMRVQNALAFFINKSRLCNAKMSVFVYKTAQCLCRVFCIGMSDSEIPHYTPFNLRLRKRWNGYKNEHALRAEVCAVERATAKYHKLKAQCLCRVFCINHTRLTAAFA